MSYNFPVTIVTWESEAPSPHIKTKVVCEPTTDLLTLTLEDLLIADAVLDEYLSELDAQGKISHKAVLASLKLRTALDSITRRLP